MSILVPKPYVIKRERVPIPDDFGNSSIYLPKQSRILSFGLISEDYMCFCYMKPVLPTKEIELQVLRHLKIINTNQEFDNSEDFIFIDTIKTSNDVIWHCFVNQTEWQTYD